MEQQELLKYGNEYEMKGILFGNQQESKLLMFPEYHSNVKTDVVLLLDTEDWKKLLFQLDVVEIEGLNKTILRKSQRNVEQGITWNVFRRDNYTCQYCGKNDVPLTVDHIVRWEMMGANDEKNLISCCRKCNKVRGRMEYDDWLNHDYLIKLVKDWKDYKWGEYIRELRAFGEKAKKVPLRPTERSR